MSDIAQQLGEIVTASFAQRSPLRVISGNSKAFLGEPGVAGEPLDVSKHRGIVNYQPGELTVTVRAGTPLAQLQAALAEHNQMLAFEPPHFGASATIGGTIAAGLSGPARAYTGAARDFVLGCRIINGRGQILRFGGEVMKNVAGYDLSRLMAGAFGTLGVLLEVSLKVLPKPAAQTTLVQQCNCAQAITRFNQWAGKPLPITATWWHNGRAFIRLAGDESAVAEACDTLGGDTLDNGAALWTSIREHQHEFFCGDTSLWRLSLAPATPPLQLPGNVAIGWGGAQRWLVTSADEQTIRDAAAATGGHASCWRGAASPRFHPLSEALMTLHRNLKQAMDPAGILNPGRLYPTL